ncbi:MAG: hypothetical protein U0936_21480 [Planctomycetaceae bacterium]
MTSKASDNNSTLSSSDERSTAEQLLSGLLYGVSLPERLVRSAVGITAGTAKEIAEFVVPQAFQDSKSYEVAVRNSLNFLLANVATVSDPNAEKPNAPPITTPADDAQNDPTASNPGRFIARKAVGNFIDIAGLATLHVSPLWILAIVSDAAYGTKTYLSELAGELQSQGLIDDSSTIHRVDDLFEAIKKASGRAASNFDTPPLSLDELKTSFEQTRAALNEVDPTLLIPEAEIGRIWTDMRSLADQEKISLLGVSGAVAMQAVETIKTATQGSLTGLFVEGKIVNRNIFGHYISALSDIHKNGLWSSVRDTYGPYVDLAWGNFTSSRKTWTEQVHRISRFARLWAKICPTLWWFVAGQQQVRGSACMSGIVRKRENVSSFKE